MGEEPNAVLFCASDYADKLTFDAIPGWRVREYLDGQP